MKPQWLSLLLTLCSLCGAHAQISPIRDADDAIVQTERTLSDARITLTDLPKEMRFADLLVAIEKQLAKDKQVSVRLDENALGADLKKIAEQSVQRPPFVPQVPLRTLLHHAFGQIDAELGIALRPGVLLVTRPTAAVYTRVYDVRDLVDLGPQLLRQLGAAAKGGTDDELPSVLTILRLTGDLQAGESMQIVNGTRIILRAGPNRQLQLQDMIGYLRRLAELQVYMNARLYEVPQAFYAEHLGPLFKRDHGKEPPAAITIPTSLVKRIVAHKLLLESEDISVRPGEKKSFLAWHESHVYSANPNVNILLDRTVFSGLTLEVNAQVSADRRFLKLDIAQRVQELLAIDKVKQLDPATGKEYLVQQPRLRRTTSNAIVKIPDVGAILAPIDFRPPDKEAAGKIWVMVARPMIWIPDEIAHLRKEGKIITPKSAWQMEPDVPDPEPPAPPLTQKNQGLLQALLTDVLTNPELKETRSFYGGDSKNLMLEAGNKARWPTDFAPSTHGYRLVASDPFDGPERALVVRLDVFSEKANPEKKAKGNDPEKKEPGEKLYPIQVSIASGGMKGGTIGACWVYYSMRIEKGRWTVQFEGADDP